MAQPQPLRAPDPKPKPDYHATPHPEDFAAWCEHPCTRFVAAAFEAAAAANRDAWLSASWGTGKADQETLTKLQARADAYMAFLETGLNDYAKLLET